MFKELNRALAVHPATPKAEIQHIEVPTELPNMSMSSVLRTCVLFPFFAHHFDGHHYPTLIDRSMGLAFNVFPICSDTNS